MWRNGRQTEILEWLTAHLGEEDEVEVKKGEDAKVEVKKGEDAKVEVKKGEDGKGEEGDREMVVPKHRRRVKSFRP